MQKANLIRRYIIFIIGLYINSLGVALVTLSNLGTSPISSIPYVLSLQYPPSLGVFTIYFSILLVILQILILGEKFEKINLIQIPVSIAFGYFIDLSVALFSWVNPENYAMRFVCLIIGCVVLGFGVYTEVIANVVMLPGESFVRSVTIRFKTNFGKTKIGFDSSMTVIAGVLSFIFFHRLNGVGIGTVIAALAVGFIANQFGRILTKFTALLLGKAVSSDTASSKAASSDALSSDTISSDIAAIHKEGTVSAKEGSASGSGTASGASAQGSTVPGKPESARPKAIITIAREFGSGGSIIGEMVSKRLGIPYYDAQLLKMVSEEENIPEEKVEHHDQQLTGSLLYDLYLQSNDYTGAQEYEPETIYRAMAEVIRRVAAGGPCVIVGRLANFILEDQDTFDVFLYGEMQDKVKLVAGRDHVSEEEAEKRIRRKDKNRRNHCRMMTGKEWGRLKYYDAALNTSTFGLEKTAEEICYLYTEKTSVPV